MVEIAWHCRETRRSINKVVFNTRQVGSYLYRPRETIQALSNGTVSIGVEGLAEWRSLDTTGITETVIITPAVAGLDFS